MAACNQVVAALNFLTGEGIDYYPDNCNKKDVGALIGNCFENRSDEESDCKSADESSHRNEGAKIAKLILATIKY